MFKLIINSIKPSNFTIFFYLKNCKFKDVSIILLVILIIINYTYYDLIWITDLILF